MKSLLSWTKEKITYRATSSTRASSQRDNAIKSLEEDFRRVSSLLEGLVKALRAFAESHSATAKHAAEVADVLAKAAAKERERIPDGPAETSVFHFSRIEKVVASSEEAIATETTGKVVAYLLSVIKNDLKANITSLKVKFDKSAEVFDAAVARAQEVRQAKKLDVNKMFAAERDLARAKKTFDDISDDLYFTLSDTMERLEIELMSAILDLELSQRSSIMEALQSHQEMVPFFQELVQSSNASREQFDERIYLRSESMNAALAKQHEDRFLSLVELICDNELSFMATLNSLSGELPNVPATLTNIVRIGLAYGKEIPIQTIGHILDPNVNLYENLTRENIDRSELISVREFLRNNCTKLCQTFVAMNQRDRAIQLCTVLGHISVTFSGGWDMRPLT